MMGWRLERQSERSLSWSWLRYYFLITYVSKTDLGFDSLLTNDESQQRILE